MVRWGYCGIWWNQKWMILVLSTVYSYYRGIVMSLVSTFFFWKSLLQFIIITPLVWCVKVKQRQTVCLLAQKKGIFCLCSTGRRTVHGLVLKQNSPKSSTYRVSSSLVTGRCSNLTRHRFFFNVFWISYISMNFILHKNPHKYRHSPFKTILKNKTKNPEKQNKLHHIIHAL